MSLIERAEWQIAVCRDCGRHESDPVDPCVCEPDGPKVMFSVEVVDAATLRGAVALLREAQRSMRWDGSVPFDRRDRWAADVDALDPPTTGGQ
jgi:hypothetical protein